MSQKSDLISRDDAIRWVKTECNPYGKPALDFESGKKVIQHLAQMPSADRPTTDCTKFMEWLKAEVLDEENWELNAVANGEIICRKFRKLGWLDVEDGYYVNTRPTGEWVEDGYCDQQCVCSHCGGSSGTQFDGVQPIPLKTKFCPNCGAYMNETRAYGQ